MRSLRFIAAFVAVLVLATPARAQQATAADTAKFLAGMPLSAGSPLTPLTKDGGWQQHASAMNRGFAVLEKTQLNAIREWSKDNIKSPSRSVFYMFSGPDYLFADAFFPNATSYVLVGLEPIGQIPDVMKTKHAGLGHLQHAMRTLLALMIFVALLCGTIVPAMKHHNERVLQFQKQNDERIRQWRARGATTSTPTLSRPTPAPSEGP